MAPAQAGGIGVAGMMRAGALGMVLGLASIACGEPALAEAQQAAPAQTGSIGTPVEAAKPAVPAAPGYYIEFRVAEIGTYGHSYVAYGKLNSRSQPADYHFTDLHPMGNYLIMAVGHVLPVPANTQWDPDVLKLPVSSSYRRNLSAAEYARLLAAVRKAQSDKHPYWNAVSNNCNHYIGELARAIGMKVPSDFQLSYAFVPALRDLNEGAGSGPVRPAALRRTPTAHQAPAVEQKPKS